MRREDGVSLVEVLVAMVLVAVAVLAVVREIETSERVTARAARLQLAAATASSSLERLRALPYDRIAVAPAAGAAPAGDVEGRRAPHPRTGEPGLHVPGRVEALVPEDRAAPLPAYERLVVPTGGARVVLHVHRFVTWRDEECELPGAPDLEDAVAAARDGLRDARAAAAALDSEAAAALERLPDGVAAADGAADVALRPLRELVAVALADAEATLAAAEVLLDPVSGRLRAVVDLCDLPPDALPQPRRVRAGDAAPLAAALRGARPAVVALAAARDPAALAAGTTEVTGHLAAIASAAEETAAPVQEAGEALRRLADALADPGTERNTKRIVVAVAVEGDLAPKRPAWASTVVTDPEEGLL